VDIRFSCCALGRIIDWQTCRHLKPFGQHLNLNRGAEEQICINKNQFKVLRTKWLDVLLRKIGGRNCIWGPLPHKTILADTNLVIVATTILKLVDHVTRLIRMIFHQAKLKLDVALSKTRFSPC